MDLNWGIGIDVGGTVIKAAAVDRKGKVLARDDRPTHDGRDTVHHWAGRACELVAQFRDELGGDPAFAGVCSPGLVADDDRSIAYLPGKLEGLEGFDWTDALDLGIPVPVVNDAHAALLGEAWVGAARGKRHVVLYTLGTGVGGAILVDGQILKGAIGRAGHLGHASLDPDGPVSITGMPGAIEVLIGNCTISERGGGRYPTTHALIDAHRRGDEAATAIWLRSVRALGCAIASTINIIDPEVVVIGGGIAAAGDALFAPLHSVLDEVEWRPGGHAVPLVPATLGEWAGTLGAARAGLQFTPRNPAL